MFDLRRSPRPAWREWVDPAFMPTWLFYLSAMVAGTILGLGIVMIMLAIGAQL